MLLPNNVLMLKGPFLAVLSLKGLTLLGSPKWATPPLLWFHRWCGPFILSSSRK